jgi:hypothetical protein
MFLYTMKRFSPHFSLAGLLFFQFLWTHGKLNHQEIEWCDSGARIQEDSQRHMAVEERKFTSTVVVTANRDTVLLGGRGTRRERKLPQRYQATVASHWEFPCKITVLKLFWRMRVGGSEIIKSGSGTFFSGLSGSGSGFKLLKQANWIIGKF